MERKKRFTDRFEILERLQSFRKKTGYVLLAQKQFLEKSPWDGQSHPLYGTNAGSKVTHARSFKAWLQLPSRFFSKANICKAISSVLPLRVPNFSLKLFFQIFYLNFISGENSSFFLPSLSLCTFSRSTIPRTVSSSHRGDRYFVFERNCGEEKEITPIDRCPFVAVHEFSLS